MNLIKRSVQVESLINEASSISSETIANSSIAMSERFDNSDLVKNFATDVLIIQGKHDSIVLCEMMED